MIRTSTYDWLRRGVHGEVERRGTIVVVETAAGVTLAGMPPVLEPVEARWLAERLKEAAR